MYIHHCTKNASKSNTIHRDSGIRRTVKFIVDSCNGSEANWSRLIITQTAASRGTQSSVAEIRSQVIKQKTVFEFSLRIHEELIELN